MLSIFDPKSPLHDGAVVLQGDRLAAAGVLLPLTESRMLDKRLGTRHRAAVGISEVTDALAIVVSVMTVKTALIVFFLLGYAIKNIVSKINSMRKKNTRRFWPTTDLIHTRGLNLLRKNLFRCLHSIQESLPILSSRLIVPETI